MTIELAPYETLIIEGEILRNGCDKRTLTVAENARILREYEILTEDEANTPAKMLYLAIEHAFLAKANHEAIKAHIRRIADELADVAPPLKAAIDAVTVQVDANLLRAALQAARTVICEEAELLKRVYVNPPANRRARH